jgi:hypothetical protein
MFGSTEFLELAKHTVYEMALEGLCATDNIDLKIDDVYVTWFGFILGGMKALLSTSLPDGRYYEVTYNKEKKEIYVDCYAKLKNKVVTVNI